MFGEEGHFLRARSLHAKGWVVRNFRTLKRQEKMSNVPKWGTWAFTERPFLLQFKKKNKKKIEKRINIRTLHLDRPDNIFPHQISHVSVCRNHQNNPPILTYPRDSTSPFPHRTTKKLTQHLPSKSGSLLAPSPILKHQEGEPRKSWSL